MSDNEQFDDYEICDLCHEHVFDCTCEDDLENDEPLPTG